MNNGIKKFFIVGLAALAACGPVCAAPARNPPRGKAPQHQTARPAPKQKARPAPKRDARPAPRAHRDDRRHASRPAPRPVRHGRERESETWMTIGAAILGGLFGGLLSR